MNQTKSWMAVMARSCQLGICRLEFVAVTFMIFLVAVIGAMTPVAHAELMHPNHVSLAEIEFNPKTGNLEISLCVHCEDLEQVLKQLDLDVNQSGEVFRLNETSVDRYAPKWLAKRFVVRSSVDDVQSVQPIRWIGCELDIKKAWLFFEVQLNGAKKLQLDNCMFLKLNEDQTNHVKFKHGNRLNWYQANRKQTSIEVEL